MSLTLIKRIKTQRYTAYNAETKQSAAIGYSAAQALIKLGMSTITTDDVKGVRRSLSLNKG
jgi:hypothetical protein